MQGKKFKQINQEERIRIEVLLQQGSTLSKIACLLNRSVSTISREISRNGSGRGKRSKYYSSVAHQKALKRHRSKRKRIYFDGEMKERIAHLLTEDRWSPELISVQGRNERKDFVSHEWIYQWIWRMKFSQCKANRKWQGLYRYLKHARRHKKRGNYRNRRGNIIDRIWIDQRPAIVNERHRMGDLEVDLILGKERQPGLLVALDRKCRKAWLRKLKSKQANHVIGHLKQICSSCEHPVKTITLDNDQSFAQHYVVTKELGIPTYFTHPYSSQEKGSVENRIGIIRMFFPKSTDFKLVTDKEVKQVETKINNRPLRMFNYKTPNEAYQYKNDA